jgi:uncharacterized membrane protein (DUF373 family)
MLQLSYISTATRSMTAEDLTDILRVARARNADRGITGMLLYSNHEELSLEDEDRFIVAMHRLIRYSVKLLAVLMVFTILWSVLDVVVVIYEKFLRHPFRDLGKEEILQVFGSFMLVLIAIEIFINITLYIRSHVIPVKLVVATALMAVARKIIVFDFHEVGAFHVFATGLLVAALGGTYWLLEREFNPHAD